MKLSEVKKIIAETMSIKVNTIVRTESGLQFTTEDQIVNDDLVNICNALNIVAYCISPQNTLIDTPRLKIELFDLFLEDEENDNSDDREIYRLRKELGWQMVENMKLKAVLEENGIEF